MSSRNALLLQILLQRFELFGLSNVCRVEKSGVYRDVKHVFIFAKLLVEFCFYIANKGQVFLVITVFVDVLQLQTSVAFVIRSALAHVLRQINVCKFIHVF